MKKFHFVFFIFFLFTLCSYANSADVILTPSKTMVNPGETAVVKAVFDGIKPIDTISASDFSLTDSNGNKLIVGFTIIKIADNNYYIYFDMPAVANSNFKFGLDGFKYFLGSEFKKNDFTIELNTNNELQSIGVRPGAYIFTNVEDYEQPVMSFLVKAKNQATTVSITGSESFILPVFSGFSLKGGGSKSVDVKAKIFRKPQKDFFGYVIFSYDNSILNIPVHIFRKGYIPDLNISNNSVPSDISDIIVDAANDSVINFVNDSIVDIPAAEKGELKLVNSPIIFNVTAEFDFKDEETGGVFKFKNIGQGSLKNVIVKLEGIEEITSVDKVAIDYWPADTEIDFTVNVNPSKAKKEKYAGRMILISSDGVTTSLSFFINIKLPSNPNVVTPTTLNRSNGTGIVIPTDDSESSGVFQWVIILIAFIAIIGVIIYLYKKQKPKKQAYDNMVESFRKRI